MTIAFSRYYEELSAIAAAAERAVAMATISNGALLRGRIADARERLVSQAPLRVVLIGEFSAGKSSLIAALTGADVAVNADVCTTDVSEHPWQGILLIDTPGIQAEGSETDHDRIARTATIGADLVLFVITNELFNPRLARHLRFILDEDGLGLANKTALIVNKIDRETNAEGVLRGEIQKVLGPHQNLNIYFCAAAKYLRVESADADLKERYIRQSYIPALTAGIDNFVSDAGTLGRLTTPLQVVASTLDSVQASLAPTDMDKKRLEVVRRQKSVLQQLQGRLFDLRKTWKQQAYSTVLNRTEGTVEEVGEHTTAEDLEALFKNGMALAVAELDSLHTGVASDVAAALDDAQEKLNQIGESPLARDVRAAGERGDYVGVKFAGDRPGGSEIAAKLGKAAAKPIQEILQQAAQNAKGLKDVVYSVGKAMGKKFRPWEAVNYGKGLAKIAGKASKAVPYLAAALDFYLQYRDEKGKEEKIKYLANMRMSLRNAFAAQAKSEAEALESSIVGVSQGPIGEALVALDTITAEVTAAHANREELACEINALTDRCTGLHTAILGGVELMHAET